MESSSSNYFEGIIEYTISYDVKSLKYSEPLLKEYFGSKMIKKFKNGNKRDEYYNDKGELIRTSILNIEEKKYCMQYRLLDTIYWTNINDTNYDTKISKKSDSSVNDHQCWVVRSASIEKDIVATDSIISLYYLSKKLMINENWYSAYIDGAHNKVAKLAPGMEYKTMDLEKDYNTIKQATKIVYQNMDSINFKIPETGNFKKF